jgi:hypothetical protein
MAPSDRRSSPRVRPHSVDEKLIFGAHSPTHESGSGKGATERFPATILSGGFHRSTFKRFMPRKHRRGPCRAAASPAGIKIRAVVSGCPAGPAWLSVSMPRRAQGIKKPRGTPRGFLFSGWFLLRRSRLTLTEWRIRCQRSGWVYQIRHPGRSSLPRCCTGTTCRF